MFGTPQRSRHLKSSCRREIGELLGAKETTLRNWIRIHEKQEVTPVEAKMSYVELEKAYDAVRQRNQRLERPTRTSRLRQLFRRGGT